MSTFSILEKHLIETENSTRLSVDWVSMKDVFKGLYCWQKRVAKRY